MKILTIANKTEEKFLRTKTTDFDFSKHNKKEIDELIKKIKTTMIKANGIGLSANQIGLNLKVFIARIIAPKEKNFYVIFNPEIIKFSKQTETIEEGCLSVPGIYGEVERPKNITIKGQNRYGKPIKIEADGLLARIFQHETDHLNGILFIDKAKNINKSQ